MCIVKNCRKDRKPGSSYCHSCAIRRFKNKHPEKYAYFVQKNNARRRKHEFSVTFGYWLNFVIKSNYMAGKGITKNSLHVDRIDESKGYVEGNLQVLNNSDNIKKYLSYQYDEKGKPTFYRINKVNYGQESDDPF